MLKSGFVSIVGRPNVGKSTLMNTIIGEKIAIVSDKPQTTRNRIHGIYTTDKGQIIFIDTPGIHKPKHLLGEYMVKISTRSLNEVDMVYYMTDITKPFGKGEQYIINQLKEVRAPVFLLVNKIDLAGEEELQKYISPFLKEMNFTEIIPLSAALGTNVTDLLEKTLDYLPEGPHYYPAEEITDQPEKLFMAELIREKALNLTREEIPHSLAVEIEEIKERDHNKIYVRAVIYTERESQKGIIIGKNGSMLKKIGEQARVDMENLLDTDIYLDLWVKVKKNWRDSEGKLMQLGYK